MNKFFYFLVFILLTSFGSARLTSEQVSQATNYISQACNNQDFQSIENWIISQDCGPGDNNVTMSSNAFEGVSCSPLGDTIIYRCLNGVHYLNDFDLTTTPTIRIQDSNFAVDSPGSTQTVDKSATNFNFQLAFTLSLMGNIIEIGIIIALVRKKVKNSHNRSISRNSSHKIH